MHQPASFKSTEAVDLLRGLDADALIVVAYGLILPPAALAAPRLGCFNLHASLLPRWRGAAPIQRAIQAGDPATGVSIMRMEPGLDTGPVLAQRRVEIDPADTAVTLHDRLAVVGAMLMRETLDAVARGAAVETPQPAAGVTYAAKIDKSEAMIDWRLDAVSIVRQVRAFIPWPVAETRFRGRQLRIWGAEVAPAANRGRDRGRARHRGRRLETGDRRRLRPRIRAHHDAAVAGPQGGVRAAICQRRTARRGGILEPMKAAADAAGGGGPRGCAGPRRRRDARRGARRCAASAGARDRAAGSILELRRRARLLPPRGHSAGLLSKPVRSLDVFVRALLSVALFELEDARSPDYAVVDAAVNIAKAGAAARVGGFVNAVLRRYLREREAIAERIGKDPAARRAAPGWLAKLARADWPERWIEVSGGRRYAGADVAARRRAANDGEPTTSPACATRASARARRRACRTPWCSTRHATSRTCPASRRASCRCKTWARSWSLFAWIRSPASACSTRAPRPAGKPR